MKLFLAVLLLCLFVSVHGLTARQEAALDKELERIEKTFTNEVEYADHVAGTAALSPSATIEPVSHEEHELLSEDPHLLIETERALKSQLSDIEDQHADEQLALLQQQEEASDKIDTDVYRNEALTIHEEAQTLADEAHSSSSALLELVAKQAPTQAELKEDAAITAAEQKDKLVEKVEDQQDAADEQRVRSLEAAALAALQGGSGGAAPAPATSASAPAAAAPAPAKDQEPFEIPALLTDAQKQRLRDHFAATASIKSALGDVANILDSKDRAIRRLVRRVAKLTRSVGKLAAKNDIQKNIITLLKTKLDYANAKNAELSTHVDISNTVVNRVRAQLDDATARLDSQDKTTKLLTDFLNQNADNTPLPDDLTAGDIVIDSANRNRLNTILSSTPSRRFRTRRFRPVVYNDAAELVVVSPQQAAATTTTVRGNTVSTVQVLPSGGIFLEAQDDPSDQ